MPYKNGIYSHPGNKTVSPLLSCSLEWALACFLKSTKNRNEIEVPKLPYNNKVIENMKQPLCEEEFAKLESNFQGNLAKLLIEATGIEE